MYTATNQHYVLNPTGLGAYPVFKYVTFYDNTPPSNPKKIAIERLGEQAVLIQWVSSESPDVQGYKIFINPPNSDILVDTTEYLYKDVGNTILQGLDDPNLKVPGVWKFRITSYDRKGLESPGEVFYFENFNTPAGDNIQVIPEDLTTGEKPVDLLFENVNQAGNTILKTSQSGSAIPQGFSFGDPVNYFDLETTAQFSGNINIAVDYRDIRYENEASLRLFHYADGAWTDVTTSVDKVIKKIYGEVTSLSTFIVLQDNKPPKVITKDLIVPLDASGNARIDASDIDNGSNDENGIASMSLNISEFNCSNIGDNIITLTVTDLYNNSAIGTSKVTIQDNIPPVISCPNNIIQPADPGKCNALVSIPLPFFNDNCDEISCTNNYNGTDNASGNYKVGTTIVVWTVIDGSGNSADCQMTITINDFEPPQIILPAVVAIPNDPGKCSVTSNLETPDVIDNCGVEEIISDAPTDFPVGSTLVTWTATDIHGNISIAKNTIEIINEAPIIENISAPIDPVLINSGVNLTATYLDNNVATATWDWGDGIISQGIIGTNIGGEHIYTDPGVYIVTLSLVDLCGKSTTSSYQYLVVYDPNGGFVTGGGWIDSPMGAYNPDITLFGKANFGFVAKYKKGSTIPDGNTEFQFKAGNLNFRSSSYEDMRLVIAGAKANFKGDGTINGTGNYGFMVSAIDGQISGGGGVDKFRIKIWDLINTDVIVYDNNLTYADENAEPVTAIEGGSIVIHAEQSKSGESELSILPEIENLVFKLYPNPFSESLQFEFASPKEGYAHIEIFDVSGRLVKVIFNDHVEGGVYYKAEFRPENALDGLYIYRMKIGEKEFVGKAIYKK